MRLRDLSILLGTLCLLAGLGVAFLQQDSMAEELAPPDAAPSRAVDPGPERTPDASTPTAAASHGGSDSVVAADAVATKERVDTAGWTSGVVRGDIQLAVSVLDRIKTITIHVEEARNPVERPGTTLRQPYRRVEAVKLGAGTPTFEVTGIPFSEYPYVVTAHAPGLNGGRRTVTLDKDHPLVDDVVLAITAGAPFTVLLRDQEVAPYPALDVLLQPIGVPLGRPKKHGTSDNYGSVVFEDVLAGDYDIHVAQGGQPLVDPQRVTVQPGAHAMSAKLQSQGHTVVIPRGTTLQLRVHDVRGYGLAEVTATATAADKVRLTTLEATSDFGGNITFPHLTPGTWQIDVLKTDFQRATCMVTIKAGEAPPLQEMQLIRLR